MSSCSALLLCAGQSSRMNPLSDKIFFEYLGKSLLEWKIEELLHFPEISEIFIVGNRGNIKNIERICQEKFPGKAFVFTVQEKPEEGMMGGILSIVNIFPKNQALFIVSSNDMVEKSCIEAILSQKNTSNSEIFLCGKKVNSYFPGGYLEVKNGIFVEKITEKPGEGNEPSDMINLVFHFFSHPELLFSELLHIRSQIPVENDDAYERALQRLFERGISAEVVPYNGFWQALKYPWHHLDMMHFFLSRIETTDIHPSAYISKNAAVNGHVIIAEGVKIFDFAVINGPAYIGKNTIIGNHALIRQAILGENCGIGHTTEVARSFLRNGVTAHQSYIGDSVIDEEVNFGAGTRTGNLRHDGGEISAIITGKKVNSGKTKLGMVCGKGVKIGINTSISPGVSVGKNSFLSPGMCITQNIPENSFVKRKFRNEELEICENRENS